MFYQERRELLLTSRYHLQFKNEKGRDEGKGHILTFGNCCILSEVYNLIWTIIIRLYYDGLSPSLSLTCPCKHLRSQTMQQANIFKRMCLAYLRKLRSRCVRLRYVKARNRVGRDWEAV